MQGAQVQTNLSTQLPTKLPTQLPTKPVVFAMSVTPFEADGSLAEEGLRLHLRRLVASGCGVEECKGRAPVCANPPEQRTAKAMIDVAREAATAGVDRVQVYQVDGGHGMRPTPGELDRYIRTVLDAVDHPTALSCHFYSGYQ